MRVVNSSVYRNYTSSMNNVHSKLIKSINKVQSGKEYESAADNPLAYYKCKEIDNQYLEILSKSQLIGDVKKRLEQQEIGARDIQTTLAEAKNNVINKALTGTTSETAMDTLRAQLLQYEHNIVNDLQTQYQDFYIYGGNDVSTPPFSLSADGKTFTFTHTFPGESTSKEFIMKLDETTKKFTFDASSSGTEQELIQAMSEQGFMDLGYGDIRDRSTLLDTFTGGMNLLTGLTSQAVKEGANNGTLDINTIMDRLSEGPLGLTARGVQAMDKYLDANNTGYTRKELNEDLGNLLNKMTESEHETSAVYSDLGNKYNLLDNLETKLKKMTDSLKEQYKDTVGADPYTAIYEMYNSQYSYNAALQVGSSLMGSSLFDFIR